MHFGEWNRIDTIKTNKFKAFQFAVLRIRGQWTKVRFTICMNVSMFLGNFESDPPIRIWFISVGLDNVYSIDGIKINTLPSVEQCKLLTISNAMHVCELVFFKNQFHFSSHWVECGGVKIKRVNFFLRNVKPQHTFNGWRWPYQIWPYDWILMIQNTLFFCGRVFSFTLRDAKTKP